MGRWIGLWAACLVLSPRAATATCMQMPCEAEITRADGAPVRPEADGVTRLAPGEPFVVRLSCRASCAAGGRAAPPFELDPQPLSFTQFGPDQQVCARAAGTLVAGDDPRTFVADSGLPPGRYLLGPRTVQVGEGAACASAESGPPGRHAIAPRVVAAAEAGAGDAVDLAPQVETPRWTPQAGATTPPPSAPARRAPAAEDWDDRTGAVWEVAAGPWLGGSAQDGGQARLDVGAVVALGVHGVLRSSSDLGHEKFDFPEYEAMRFCAPLACLGIGLLFAPAGVLVGNELGVEARGVVAGPVDGGAALGRASLRPYFRYARGTLRTQSFVGLFVPEVGAQWRDGETSLALAWSLYPLDVRFAPPLALSLDPARVGLVVGEDLALDVGGEITLRYAP